MHGDTGDAFDRIRALGDGDDVTRGLPVLHAGIAVTCAGLEREPGVVDAGAEGRRRGDPWCSGRVACAGVAGERRSGGGCGDGDGECAESEDLLRHAFPFVATRGPSARLSPAISPSWSGGSGGAGAAGSVRTTSAPRAVSVETATRPSCASTIALTIASPRPAPPLVRAWSPRVKRSNAVSAPPLSKPAPSSAMWISTPSAAEDALSLIVP